MQKIILFDIDKTVYDGFVIFPLAKEQVQANLLDDSCLVQLEKDLADYKAGLIDYESCVAVLLDHWAVGLQGRSYAQVLAHTHQFCADHSDSFYTYPEKLIGQLRESHDSYFVTGEPQFVAEAAKEKYSATSYLSSILEVDKSGLFTGQVELYLSTKSEKRHALTELKSSHDFTDSYGFGDSDADIEMLDMVTHPFCINPNEKLKAHGEKNGWMITTPNEVSDELKNIDLDN